MDSVFKNTSVLTISLDTSIDVSTASQVAILWKNPNGQKGTWIGTASTTKVLYNVQPGDLNLSGTWQIQAYAKFGAAEAFGQQIFLNVVDSFA